MHVYVDVAWLPVGWVSVDARNFIMARGLLYPNMEKARNFWSIEILCVSVARGLGMCVIGWCCMGLFGLV